MQPIIASPSSGKDLWSAVRQIATCTAGRRFGDDDLIVEYRVAEAGGEATYHQVVAGGTIVGWERGGHPSPDLVLRQPLAQHLAMLRREPQGPQIVHATRIVDVDGEEHLPLPLDEIRRDWTSSLPLVPTAGAVVAQQLLTHTPFGDLEMFLRLEQGLPATYRLGHVDTPDVVVRRHYASALAERAGALDLFDSFDGGEAFGEGVSLSLFLGIYDSDEWVAARRRLARPHDPALAALGRLLSSDVWSASLPPLDQRDHGLESVP